MHPVHQLLCYIETTSIAPLFDIALAEQHKYTPEACGIIGKYSSLSVGCWLSSDRGREVAR